MRSCGSGKIHHPSPEMAHEQLRGLLERTQEHPKRKDRLSVYQCRCGGWLVGHRAVRRVGTRRW